MATSFTPPIPMPDVVAPDVSHLICEDGAPADSFFAEKQMRLLTAPLAANWKSPDGRPFLVAANVGVFAVAQNPAVVPDVFLSLDVEPPPLTGPQRLRSYFVWEFGKAPDVAIEVVSDTPGNELSDKLRIYERMRVTHYVVFDPLHVLLSDRELTCFSLDGGRLVERERIDVAPAGLSVTVWEGEFEGSPARWARWCTTGGVLVPTADELLEVEKQRAETEKQRAETEKQRADRLAEKLRAAGIDPDDAG